MNIQLIQGEFSVMDAVDIISQMIQTKIKYHENKIEKLSNEEDIKAREEKIKQLQKEQYKLKKIMLAKSGSIKIDTVIRIE